MFIFGHLFVGLAQLLNMVFGILNFLLIIRVILSWVNADPYNELVRTIYLITDYIIVPIRRILPLQIGMFDFSPMVAFMLIYFSRYMVVNILFSIGHSFLKL